MGDRLIVIGLTGVAGSGKDTAATILGTPADPLHYFRISLADGIKSAIRDIDGPTWSITKEAEKAGKTSRWACQRLGGEARELVAEAVRRAAGIPIFDEISEEQANRFWCHLALAKIAYLARIHPARRRRFVVPDVSYAREVETLAAVVREFGGTYETWRIDRPGAGLDGEAASHSSELGRATIPADVTVANDGTLADLERRIRSEAERIGAAQPGRTKIERPGQNLCLKTGGLAYIMAGP